MTEDDSPRPDEPASDDLYLPADMVGEKFVASPDSDLDPDNFENSELIEQLNEKLDKLDSQLKQKYDGVEDLCNFALIDAIYEDDLYEDANYDFQRMAAAWLFRLIAPSDGYSMMSWAQLADALEDDEVAEKLGFEPGNTPSEKTLRTHWWTRVRPAFREHIRYEAARKAVRAEQIGLKTAENIRQNLIADFERDDEQLDPIGEIEQEVKDDAYAIQADIIRDVCTYDRDGSIEWGENLITDAAAHMCRLNEYSEQGIERWGKETGLIEEGQDGEEEWDIYRTQTFRRAIRNVERRKVDGYYDDGYGADWLPVDDLVDPDVVEGDLRTAKEQEWTINPHNPDGATSLWHCRTEDAIGQQIQWLKDEGVIGDEDAFNLRIDYTTHNYSKHSSTDQDHPIGVHKQKHLDTGYAYKELQGTIKINGRAFIIASLNYLPTNDQFQAVRYIIDRAQELINVDTVLADAEFVDTRILRYTKHCGCDYAIRKGATESVKNRVEDFDGRADWDNDWTVISEGREETVETTLVGLEKDFKSKPDHKKSADDEDDETDHTLDEYTDEDDESVGQMTLAQAIDEPQEDEEEIDYFCIITSKPVESEGIDPDDNPVAHDADGTAWGIGRLYRDRWGVETAFRDKKYQFAAKTRSRDLGYRRFLWMMENLLYNGWVMLNTAVADKSPARDDEEIVVKQNTYLDELDRRVLGGLDLDLQFPDVEYG
ncbi:hypothetical protein OSG_eHP14_00140 [environmental Halophage eHP-14]|nr:hypothetical protein OSG_eHP14_00140 [environmental Halophage eHP-14]